MLIWFVSICKLPKQVTGELFKCILIYLRGTITHRLGFTKQPTLDPLAFCDADWGSDFDERRSTFGFCVFFGGNLISWAAKKHLVARSSTEVEYRLWQALL